jgi:glycosyltransferase involved in cell wall biosynthesis
MTPPVVSIVTPSYNKHEYVMDAVRSVFDQSITNWEYYLIDNSTDNGVTREKLRRELPRDPRLHYLEFDFTEAERHQFYVPAYIVNQVYDEISGTYVFYLSDDDIIYPKCLETQVLFLESNPEAFVCYHSQKRLFLRPEGWHEEGGVYVNFVMGKDTRFPGVDCNLDGGQIMHRRECLKYLEKPYAPESPESASHSDGLLLQKLANLWKFYPVPVHEALSAHRVTPKSTWNKV